MTTRDEDHEEDHFWLKWNNFHTNLSSGFFALFEEEDLVDVTLAVEGKYVQAHKIVLSVCSPYFKELFKENPCKHPVVILNDLGYDEVLGLVQFMYKGEVCIKQNQLPDFLKAAELLHIKGLTGVIDVPEQTDRINRISQSVKRKKAPESADFPKPEAVKMIKQEEDNSNQQENRATNNSDEFPKIPSPTQTPSKNNVKNGFQRTSRGRLQLVQNGYVYHCNRQTEEKIFWKCAEYNRTRCRSRCISVGDAVTVTHPDHNHVASTKNPANNSLIQVSSLFQGNALT